MPHTTSVDLDALEGTGASSAYASDDLVPNSAASISHAYGVDPSASAADSLLYDQDLPWPFYYISQHPSFRHYDAHFSLPRLGDGASFGNDDHVGSLAVTLLHSFGWHLRWARKGWHDANRWPDAWRLISSSEKIRAGVLKGLVVSSAISAIVFFFKLAFFPKQLFQQDAEADETSIAAWANVSVDPFTQRLSISHGRFPDLFPISARRHLLLTRRSLDHRGRPSSVRSAKGDCLGDVCGGIPAASAKFIAGRYRLTDLSLRADRELHAAGYRAAGDRITAFPRLAGVDWYRSQLHASKRSRDWLPIRARADLSLASLPSSTRITSSNSPGWRRGGASRDERALRR